MIQTSTRQGFTQKIVYKNCHAEKSLLSISTATNNTKDRDPEQKQLRMTANYNRSGVNLTTKNNCHSRMSLSGIPTLDKKIGGDPRLQASGMTLNFKQHVGLPPIVILNSIQDLALNIKAVRFQIKFGMTSLYTNGGFTLIELLVVVLIIGILAAVALPQYQKAVVRSRLANAKTILATIKNAEELYYLEHGSYTGKDQRLEGVVDIKYTCTYVDSGNAIRCDDYFIIDPIGAGNAINIRAAYCPGATTWKDCSQKQKFDFIYTIWLDHSAYPGKVTCSGRTKLGQAICKSEGF